MSPLLFYILNLMKNDAASHPRAYTRNRPPLDYLTEMSVWSRNGLAEEPIPWS